MDFLNALDQIFANMSIAPADPEGHYAEQIREIYREAYQEGLVYCIPEVTCNFNSATGEMNVHVKFPPKKIDLIEVKVTYDDEKFSY